MVVGSFEFGSVGPFPGCIDGATCLGYSNRKEILDEDQIGDPGERVRGCLRRLLRLLGVSSKLVSAHRRTEQYLVKLQVSMCQAQRS